MPAKGRRALTGRPARVAGFTLLEFVLVMMLICTVLALAAPSLRKFFASRQTSDAALQILALMQYAHTQAISEGRTYRFNLDPEGARDTAPSAGGIYWLTAQVGGAFERLGTEFGRDFLLPDGSKVEWDAPHEDEGKPYLTFLPTGRSEVTKIRLIGRQGDRAMILCDSPTELFRIATLDEEEQQP